MNQKKVITAMICMLVWAASASASVIGQGTVEIEILSDRGGQFFTIPYKDYTAGKTQVVKKYLEARKGENYSIVIRNNTPYRIGAVIAADGRNIISGKKSYLKNNEAMYILNPREQGTYSGWRTDGSTVHRFYFTNESDAYSVRTFSDSSAMGVIAVTVFREKKPRIPWFRKERSEGKAPSRSAPEAMFEDRAGTGFGDEMHSPTVQVDFKPERSPFKKILVKYEWRDRLCQMGIIQCGDYGNRLWDEHPGYAPFPPDYHGRLNFD